MEPNHVMAQSVPTFEEREFLEARLYDHSRDQTGEDDGDYFGFFIRDEESEAGEIIGGAAGWTWARACEIEQLWVHPAWRGRGYGRELLQAAEELAWGRGCEVILLDTYGFQAPEFYQKNGYELAYELEDFPPGHRTCYLVKRAAKGSSGSDRSLTAQAAGGIPSLPPSSPAGRAACS